MNPLLSPLPLTTPRRRLALPAVTPDWALNGDTVAISVNGGESGLTVTADASAIGGDAAVPIG